MIRSERTLVIAEGKSYCNLCSNRTSFRLSEASWAALKYLVLILLKNTYVYVPFDEPVELKVVVVVTEGMNHVFGD